MIKWILGCIAVSGLSVSAMELTLVTTDGCPPCATMKKRLEEMKIKFTSSSATEMMEKKSPVLILIEKNREVRRLVGLKSKEEIEKWLKE